jgi:hypothetical protein
LCECVLGIGHCWPFLTLPILFPCLSPERTPLFSLLLRALQKLDLFSGEPDLKRGHKYKAAFAAGRSDKFWSMIVEKAYVK